MKFKILTGLLACILKAAIEQEPKYIHSPQYVEVFEISEFLIGTEYIGKYSELTYGLKFD